MALLGCAAARDDDDDDAIDDELVLSGNGNRSKWASPQKSLASAVLMAMC